MLSHGRASLSGQSPPKQRLIHDRGSAFQEAHLQHRQEHVNDQIECEGAFDVLGSAARAAILPVTAASSPNTVPRHDGSPHNPP